MPIDQEAREGVLTIRILDERLVDPAQLDRLFTEIQKLLDKSNEDRVVVDFSAVGFMASSALGKLVQLNKKAKEYNVKLKISGLRPEIYEVFKITKLHKVFDIEKDEATARKKHQKKGGFFR